MTGRRNSLQEQIARRKLSEYLVQHPQHRALAEQYARDGFPAVNILAVLTDKLDA
jgi:hypothetical protein